MNVFTSEYGFENRLARQLITRQFQYLDTLLRQSSLQQSMRALAVWKARCKRVSPYTIRTELSRLHTSLLFITTCKVQPCLTRAFLRLKTVETKTDLPRDTQSLEELTSLQEKVKTLRDHVESLEKVQIPEESDKENRTHQEMEQLLLENQELQQKIQGLEEYVERITAEMTQMIQGGVARRTRSFSIVT